MLAVLVDADNLSADHAPRLLDWARQKHPHPIVQLFGDFSGGRHAGWCSFAGKHGFELVFQPSGGSGKNSTDIALTIHAMDLLQQGAIRAFCLVSNDRDFVPLARRLKRAGHGVFIAAQHPSPLFHSVSDEVLILGDEAGAVAEAQLGNARPAPIDQKLVSAVLELLGGKKEMRLNLLAQQFRAKWPKMVPPGSGKFQKALLATGRFVSRGAGTQIVIAVR